MTGLELSRAFFEEYGQPMLEREFPDLLPYLAAGLFGSGSECFGYDDEVSRDHDFEPGFCLLLPEEAVLGRREEFLLERAYARLPRTYRGFQRPKLLPVGGARRGVMRTGEFFLGRVGAENGLLDLRGWLSVPEQGLAEATNGEVYFDNWGEVSRIRQDLAFYPEDVRLKKLAGQLLLMAQSGQYNYARCLAHGEPAAAMLAAGEFVRSALSAAFLLEKRYQPYYKWSFRALRELPRLGGLARPLEELLAGGPAAEQAARIEAVCAGILQELRRQELTELPGDDLEKQAYRINDRVSDPQLRNLHVLAAV